MSNVYYVGSEPLSFEGIERILTQNMKLELSPEVKERIQRCRDYLDHKIEQQEGPLYGITTGFGSLCNKNISPDELSTLQENLVKSHACSVGDEVSPVIVRLMMLLKAHALSLGHSGVQVITVQRILDFFNNDVLPIATLDLRIAFFSGHVNTEIQWGYIIRYSNPLVIREHRRGRHAFVLGNNKATRMYRPKTQV